MQGCSFAKASSCCLAAFAAALALSACSDKRPPAPPAVKGPASGIYETAPPGIAAVRGECEGKIAFAPFVPHLYLQDAPYPVVYDCASKTFQVLPTPDNLVSVADLTLTKTGYYMHESRITDGVWHGEYYLYNRDGKEIGKLPHPDQPKVHDLILRDQDVTYIQYFDDWDAATCRSAAPLEFDIVTEDRSGKTLWKWSSKGKLKVTDSVATPQSMAEPPAGRLKKAFRAIRHCYTSLARRLVKFDPPAWFVGRGDLPVFEMEENDYAHVNSIQWIEPSGDLMFSARHHDTIYRIDRNSGEIVWSLGGKFSKAALYHPVGDPRGGFSHAHYARLVGNTLWVFDNGNLFPDLPSRVVAYQLDSKPQPNRMTFEFLEPNGKHRYAVGSVEVMDANHILIGWGAVGPRDTGSPQRAVSIVQLDNHKEVFSIDLSPGWISYRVKAARNW
jgi:hypothetical protein